MVEENVYKAPESNVGRIGDSDELADVEIFSVNGRIGRLRYMAYNFGFGILIYIIGAIVAGVIATVLPEGIGALLAGLIVILATLAVLVWSVIWTIRRCHDFNITGWLALIWILPLAPIIFWFIPGTAAANNYGSRPEPNSTGVIVAAGILPAIAILGILAAIAIPAYQDYAIRAQSQSSQP